MTAYDQPQHNLVPNDAGAIQAQAQHGATNALQREVQSTLTVADGAHGAWGSLIGADNKGVSSAKPEPTEAPANDKTAQKLNSEYAAMASLGMGDVAYNGAHADQKALGEQAAQRGRELASAGSLAFSNVFDQVLQNKSAQSGFPGSNGRGNGLFRESSSGLDISGAQHLNTAQAYPQLAFHAQAAA